MYLRNILCLFADGERGSLLAGHTLRNNAPATPVTIMAPGDNPGDTWPLLYTWLALVLRCALLLSHRQVPCPHSPDVSPEVHGVLLERELGAWYEHGAGEHGLERE